MHESAYNCEVGLRWDREYSPGNRRQSRDEDEEETAISNHISHDSVVEIVPLIFLRSSSAPVFECVKVADFAQHGARGDNTEADPQTPHNTAQYSDDL